MVILGYNGCVFQTFNMVGNLSALQNVLFGLMGRHGILAIVMDTIGFCARFFSERIEEVDPGPGQALAATGA